MQTLGILTFYINDKREFEERHYLRRLITEGEKLNWKVIVFTPEDVEYGKHEVLAHDYDSQTKKWSRIRTAIPTIIFDRCRFQPNERFKKLKEFRRRYNNLLYLNLPMANKWVIHQYLSKNPTIRPHLPPTKIYNQFTDLEEWFKSKKLIYLKPINGTGGRGILRLQQLEKDQFLVQGRNSKRQIVKAGKMNRQQLMNKLKSWELPNRYIIQHGLDLKLANGRVHDYRLLIQKNGSGEWEVTGCVGRIGPSGSVTSNLHGGGMAVPMQRLLKSWFLKEDVIAMIRQNTYKIAQQIAQHLEKRFRLCDVALDIAIDRNGHIWLLEVNPKPSREVFARIGDKETYHKAIVRPLEYAKWLSKNRIAAKVASNKR